MKHTLLSSPSSNAFALSRTRPSGPGPHQRAAAPAAPRRNMGPCAYSPALAFAVSGRHGVLPGEAQASQPTKLWTERRFMWAVVVLGGVSMLSAVMADSGGLFVLAQLCLLAMILGILFLVHGLRHSVKAVATAATRISAGDRCVRVPRSGVIGDIDELIDSFNSMAAELEASERERSQVAAGVSHELRTPLTILMARLHAIRDGVIAGKGNEPDRLLRQVEHILHIVDDLDTLSHADAGQAAFDREYFDLDEVIRPVVADLQPLLAGHGLAIDEYYRRALVLGDRRRLQQVFTNILTNAAKHSPQGARIRVKLEVYDGHVVASVTDEGPGIAPDDLRNVFKPFWRSEASRRRPGCVGTGMGLALTEKLVRAHGGRVEVANRPDRSGACFRVVLPLA